MTTRRNFLAGLAAAPALGAHPAFAASSLAHGSAPSAAICALIADYEVKEAACAAYSANIFTPARDAWLVDVDAIPHRTTSLTYLYHGDARRLSTDRSDQVAAAKTAADIGSEGLYSPDYAACCAELRGLVAEREAQRTSLDELHGIAALVAEDERLSELAWQALQKVEAFPAETIADLLAKIDFIEETGGQIDAEMLRADLRHINGEA
ncbi:MAG: hypothetical protein CL949_13835 [Erythrobacter sp.]|nr:hypothetical protein [Erythrobacter sp.]|tara:strand:+ start:3852 stop:4478 length:627 start_codon:yes stop_codon:yes gene_type:complete